MIWRVDDRRTFARLAGARRRRRGPLSLSVVSDGVVSDGVVSEGAHSALPPRLAFAIGRRVGPAVVRNRLRRQLRASAQNRRRQLRPGVSYLVGAAPAAAGMTFAELDATLGELLTATGAT